MTLEEYQAKKNEILHIISIKEIIGNTNCDDPLKCATCKGKNCCQHFPCAFSPEEFLDINNTSYMLKILKTGLIVIAKLPINIPYIRIRGINDPPKIVTNTNEAGNPCSLLSNNGCLLNSLFRPTEALLTTPMTCTSNYTAEQLIDDWKKHKKPMRKLIKECKDIDVDTTVQDIENYKRLIISL